MLSYTIFFMLDICFDSLLVSNEVKNVFPTSGVYKNSETRSHTDGFRKNNVKCLKAKGICRFVPNSSAYGF